MNSKKPFFSIIIPTYNHAHFIERCLDSLLNQSYQNWEAIVINNFSEDNTIEIVKGYRDIRIRLINNANGGIIAVSRNKGIAESKGDWICFLDSDDWWYPNKLEVCLPYLENYDLIHHDLDIYSNVEESKGIAKGRVLNGNIATDLIIHGNGLVNSSVVIRKSIVCLVGEIAEDIELIAVEDYEYWIRIARVTGRFKYIDESLGGYCEGDNLSYSTRQIGRVKYLLDRYMQDLTREEQKLAISRFHFSAARKYDHFSMYSEARLYYLYSLRTNSFRIALKAIVGYILSYFTMKYRNRR